MARQLQEELDSGSDSNLRAQLESAGVLDGEGRVVARLLEEIVGGAVGEAFSEGSKATIDVTRNDFVLYSVGEDGKDDGGKSYDLDLIFWPPVSSMTRQLMSK